MAQDSVFVDFIVFNRGELLKQNVMYVQELVKSIQNDTFREYQTTAAGDYDAEVQYRHALSLKIGHEIETGHRAGYGIVTVTDAALPVCIISTGRADHLEGLKELLLRKRIEISMKTRHDWPLLEMTEGMAFIALMRRQCGFLAGEANGLKAVVKALRREDKLYEFVPVWFDTDEIAKVGADIIRKKDQTVRDQKDRDLIRAEQATKIEAQKEAVEQKLRRDSGPRAQALVDGIQSRVKNAAERLPNELSEWEGSIQGGLIHVSLMLSVSLEIMLFGLTSGSPSNGKRSRYHRVLRILVGSSGTGDPSML